MAVERRFETGMREEASDAPGLVLGEDGIAYLVAPDGTRTAVGGGGSTPTTKREAYTGNQVLIANGDVGFLTWDTPTVGWEGGAWLDRSNVAEPSVTESGVYSVDVQVSVADSMTDGGGFYVSLYLDSENIDGETSTITGSAVASTAVLAGQPSLALHSTWYLAAGAQILVRVTNFDGVNGVHFLLGEALIQKIT